MGLFDDKTYENILEALKSNVSDDVDKREGSIIHDTLAPDAYEFEVLYNDLNALIDYIMIDTAENDLLDRKVADEGLTRKAAVQATGTNAVTFNGDNGTFIPIGTRLVYYGAEPVYFETTTEGTITSGTATVSIKAEVGGVSGNISSGLITEFADAPIDGVSSISHTVPTDGGIDQESDAALRERFYTKVRKPATSGNAYHYEQWATEVAGVGGAKAYPVWNGINTVKVVLLSDAKRTPAQSVIDAAIAHIEAEMPVGVDLTVIGASELLINVTATLTLAAGADIVRIKSDFETALTTYFEEEAFNDNTVRYSKATSFFMDIDGVIDYSAVTINGGSVNIAIPADTVAVKGTVTINGA